MHIFGFLANTVIPSWQHSLLMLGCLHGVGILQSGSSGSGGHTWHGGGHFGLHTGSHVGSHTGSHGVEHFGAQDVTGSLLQQDPVPSCPCQVLS